VRIELTNTAPRSGLPSIVTQRLDLPKGARFTPGTSHSFVWLYATRGAQFEGGTLDDEPLLLTQVESYRHQLLSTEIDIAPGQTRHLVINLVEPVVRGAAWVPVQPLIGSMPIRVKVPACT
jgi:hypothetical protein